jgi:cell division protein FtsL|tara:strand:- start:615 stop:788 length:174 start_codon:yes stop_codon:yes gene_type:complete
MKHLEDHKLNYFQHLRMALKYAILLSALSVVALVHGLFPFAFKTVVSKNLTKLSKKK